MEKHESLPSLSERYAAAQPPLTTQPTTPTRLASESAQPLPVSTDAASALATDLRVEARLETLQTRYDAANQDAKCAADRGPHPPASAHLHKPEGHRHVPIKPVKLLDKETLKLELKEKCCNHSCLDSWHIEDVLPFRSKMAERSEKERLEYILHDILPYCHTTTAGRHQYRVLVAKADGDQRFTVCRNALLVILGVSAGKLDHAAHLQRLKQPIPVHVNTQHRESPNAVLCASWWALYKQDYCEKMSDHQFELPDSESFEDSYEYFVTDQHALGLPVPSLEEFLAVRRAQFPEIKRRKKTELASCDVCSQFVIDFRTASTADAKLAIVAARRAHHALAGRERTNMQEHLRYSFQHPAQLAMLYVDYASAFKLPHFQRTPESLQRRHFIRVQTAGTTDGTTGERTLWLHLPSFEKGPNAIGTYLWHEIVKIKTSGGPGAQSRRLLVQCDNAAGENKNKFIFGVLSLFVLLGWFDEVELHMLLKGHTHDIADAAFGNFHELLFNTDFVLTIGDVAALVQKHYEPSTRPTLAVVEEVLDFKAFLDPFLNTDISNHTGMLHRANTGGPRAFKFCKMADGNVGMLYKEFAGEDGPWVGVAERSAFPLQTVPTAPWRVFKALPALGSSIPSCVAPVRIPDSLEGDTAALKKWLENAKKRKMDALAKGHANGIDTKTESAAADVKQERAIGWLDSVREQKSLLGQSTADDEPAVAAVGVGRKLLSSQADNPVPIRLVTGGPARFDSHLVVHPAGQNPHTLAAEKKRSEAKAAQPAPPALPPTIIVVSTIEQALPAAPPIPHSPQPAQAAVPADKDVDMKVEVSADTKQPDCKRARSSKRKQPAASSVSAAGELLEQKEKRNRTAARTEAKSLPFNEQRSATSIPLTASDSELFSDLSFEQVRAMKRVDVVARVAGRAERVWRVGSKTPNDDGTTFNVSLYQLPGVELSGVEPKRFRKPNAMICTT